ncbi:queuosine precursor transporter [Candidatus Xenohaliotis californiensis]
MQSIPSEALMVIEIIICILTILFFLKFFGLLGIATSATIMLIAANIQILKLAYFGWIHTEIALGTAAFASTYLISDIVTEIYGKQIAKKIVYITASAQLFFVILMIVTLGYQFSNDSSAHQSIENIFVPQIRILLVSIVSYVLSQLIDIAFFASIAKIMQGHFIWLRVNVSNFLSQIFDSILFSMLCWRIFSPDPKEISEILFVYVIFSFIPRFFIGIIITPIIYLAKSIKRNDVFI